MRAVYVAIAFVLALTVAGPASAADDSRANPWIQYPYLWDDTALVFQPVDLGYRWRLKATVENYDQRLGMFRMMVGKCANHPNARCIRVREIDRPNYKNWGEWRFDKWTVVLNAAGGRAREVTCHELGHVMGLGHHRSSGCVGTGARIASRAEIRVIRQEPYYQ